MSKKTTNLFVYGTLMSEKYFAVITGKTFPRIDAKLSHYRKVDMSDGFPFIIKAKDEEVEGHIILGIDQDTMKKLDHYEQVGDLYYREKIKVDTEEGIMPCEVYIGNIEHIQHKKLLAGIWSGAEERVEDHIEEKIEQFLEEPQTETDEKEAKIKKRIRRELLGSTVEELVKAHFEWIGMPTYVIKRNFEKPGIPTLENIKNNPEALEYTDNYITFAVKHMLLNQLEEKAHRDFRGMVKAKDPYYEHTMSLLLALHFMNNNLEKIKIAMAEVKLDTFNFDFEYVDYARGAIDLSDALYNKIDFLEYFNWLQANKNAGFLPLGVEMEFSNLGRAAVDSVAGQDKIYDGFYYAHDFDLIRRCWKLGGYIDDHRCITADTSRARGFLEYALGRYRIVGDLSKPVTDDPFILSNLIKEASRFPEVKPHSMHISIQQTYTPDYSKENTIEDFMCLLLLGGDISYDESGILRENRIYQREIFDKYKAITFLRENKHYDKEDMPREAANKIIEYQFARLDWHKDYEALLMALKGYQIEAHPRPLSLDIEKIRPENRNLHLSEMEVLTKWAETPSPLSDDALNSFMEKVERGLMKETENGPSHSREYIDKCMKKIEGHLTAKNRFIKSSHSGNA